MDPRWLSVVGLMCDMIGAAVLSYGLVISRKKAVELSLPYIAADDLEHNLGHPQAQDRLKQSRNALIGLGFLLLGFLLQILGNWPR